MQIQYSISSDIDDLSSALTNVEETLYTDANPTITWNDNLIVLPNKYIQTRNGIKTSDPIFLPSGTTVIVKTNGDSSYFFSCISEVYHYTLIENAGSTKATLAETTTMTLKTYSYTAENDMYISVCVKDNEDVEVTFSGFKNYENIENTYTRVIDFSKYGMRYYNVNNKLVINGGAYAGIIVPVQANSAIHIIANNNQSTSISFMKSIVDVGEDIDYATGSTKFDIAAGEDDLIYIPNDAKYALIGKRVDRNNATPVLCEILNYKTSKLTGKKIALDGDSICAGAGFTGGYGKFIANLYSMEYQNLGVGGGTLASGTGKHIINESMMNLDDDADYVIIEGGVNDSANGVQLGSLTLGYNNTLNNTTFYGAIEKICKQLSYKFKGKKYGFLIPHQMSKSMNPAWGNPDLATGAFYDAIIKVCAKWGVPVLDLTKEVPPFNGFVYSANADLIGVADAYTADTTSAGHGDGWHPNRAGYKKYYVDKIVAWLESM